MNIQVAKWGGSLAIRIPAKVVRQLGLREGSVVNAQLTVDGSLSIRPVPWNREAFALELEQERAAMPVAETVVDLLRGEARY